MRGTLDDPPIIIRQSRLKISMLLCGNAALMCFFAFILRSGITNDVQWTYVMLALFALLSAGVVFLLIKPTTLIIDRNGVVWRKRRSALSYEWDDFANFFVIRTSLFGRAVGAVFSDKSKKRVLGYKMIGNWTSFSFLWELSPSELVELLKAAQRRWGTSDQKQSLN